MEVIEPPLEYWGLLKKKPFLIDLSAFNTYEKTCITTTIFLKIEVFAAVYIQLYERQQLGEGGVSLCFSSPSLLPETRKMET